MSPDVLQDPCHGKSPLLLEIVRMLDSDDTAQLYDQSFEATNRPQEFCNIELLYRDENEPSGFQLKVPVIEVLDITQELLDILDDFAAKSVVNLA